MRLSRETRYAILALDQLSSRPLGEIMPAEELARSADLPLSYLRKILRTLVRAGILRSFRGRGYELLRPAATIRLTDVLSAVGDDALVGERCIFWREECSVGDPCPLHWRWQDLRPAVESELARLTIEQVREARQASPPAS
jgi:Rrf2 family protein